MLIVLGLGYAAFITKNKGIISFDKKQLVINGQTNQIPKTKINGTANNSNDDFSGYGVQLLATKEPGTPR